MKKLNFKNLFFNIIVGAIACLLFSVTPALAIGTAIIGGTLLSGQPSAGIFMAGLQKEIWTDILLEGFYPEGEFISEGRDMSELVEFNTINLAEAGANPSVLIDNTSYPISAAVRTDVPLTLPLKTLDTTSTIVRNLEAMELAYDKMASVIYGHKQELLAASIKLAAWNWSPASDDAFTPVLVTNGTASETLGTKKLTFKDILNLATRFNLKNIPAAGRVLVLNPYHEADLFAEDMTMYKTMFANGAIFGFKVYRTSETPRYNKTTGVKVAYGAVAADTDTVASFAFQKNEVMRANGTTDMFYTLKDPAQKGDIVNFQKRFVALPLRSKGFGAIYSADPTA